MSRVAAASASGDEEMAGVEPNRRPVNMVFQQLALFPMMNVAENIAFGLRRRGVRGGELRKRVEEILERVGLPGYGQKKISQISGGQKQRVALARCLVLRPVVLLLDEPLGALDLKLREQMKVELKKLQQQVGTTFVYITHDQSEAMVMSDLVAVMRDGRFEQMDTPQNIYNRPATPFVAQFVGNNNRFLGRLRREGDGPLLRRKRGPEPLLHRPAGKCVQRGPGGDVRPPGGHDDQPGRTVIRSQPDRR